MSRDEAERLADVLTEWLFTSTHDGNLVDVLRRWRSGERQDCGVLGRQHTRDRIADLLHGEQGSGEVPK